MSTVANGTKQGGQLSDKVRPMQLAKVVPIRIADEEAEEAKSAPPAARRRKKKPPPARGAHAPKNVALASEVSALGDLIRANATPEVECIGLFDHCGVPGACVIATALGSLPPGQCAITHLTLDGNWIGDEGALLLAAQLGRMPRLQVLELRDNLMHDEGVRAVCRALQAAAATAVATATPSCLERLSLSANAVGTRGAKAVAELAMAVPTLRHVLLLQCENMTLPSLGCFTRAVLEMPAGRPLTFFEGLEWHKLCEPMKLKKKFEFDAEVLAHLTSLREARHTRERERLLRLETTLQEKWHVHEVDRAESMLRAALQTGNEDEVRAMVNLARGMDCPDSAPWMVLAVNFIKECVAARKRETAERKRRRRWRREEKARREREREARLARELEERLEHDRKPRGMLMFTLLCGFCCLLTACGLRPAFLNAKDRMTYVVARLNVTCFAITFAFGIFILYLVAAGDDAFLRAAAATVTEAAASATGAALGAAGANVSTEVEANIDGHTFEPCTADDVMPALHFYPSRAACEAGGLAVTHFLPFETPQACESGLVSTLRGAGDTNCDDGDNDGVCDAEDSCLGDAANDADADGICDGVDSCPNDRRNDADYGDPARDGVCDGICESLGGAPASVRDNVCDANNNINACSWDGGDCSAATCAKYDNGDVWAGDGVCDTGGVNTNAPECSWDGGDCCSADQNRTSCLDPYGDRPCAAAWTEWTSCNICGRDVLQYRTFNVATPATGLGACIHRDGFVDTQACLGDTYFPCDTDGDGIDDEDDWCTCDNRTGGCPDDANNPDVDSDFLCDIGFDPCIDGEWLAPQTGVTAWREEEPNDEDYDGVCDSVDTCPYDAENDLDGDGVCDGDGLFNVARVIGCVPLSECPTPLAEFCGVFNATQTSSSGNEEDRELYFRLSCGEVCLRNSVVQRSCNDSDFSVESPLLPVAHSSGYVGLPGVVNRCVETAPGSGVWLNSTCDDYVPGLGVFADSHCSVALEVVAGSPDFRNSSVVDGMRVEVPDSVAGVCAADALAAWEHRCFVRTSLDETVTIVIIASVAVVGVLVLALVIKNIVDRKKYQEEVYEEEVISDSSEEEEEDPNAEVDEFDVDEFGRSKEEQQAAAEAIVGGEDDGATDSTGGGGDSKTAGEPATADGDVGITASGDGSGGGDADPAVAKRPAPVQAFGADRATARPPEPASAGGGGGGGGGGGDGCSIGGAGASKTQDDDQTSEVVVVGASEYGSM